MLNFIFWIIFGFLAGWVGAIMAMARENRSMSIVLSGIGGGLLGGMCVQLLTRETLLTSYNASSIIGATIFSIVTVAVVVLFDSQQTSN